jgi:DNA-directed RNA polymerase subunit N (RpoN/RPB10)
MLVRNKEEKQKFACHVDKRAIDPDQDTNLTPIFEALRIEKYCCRKAFTSGRIMSELRA